ncbi:hypothetical protein [Zunongwangia sp. H14]|uniref:hypothetical protein n=1 Tax=Zunongwangia sp. H14 TaxID=3240792 RepID=UPI003563A5CF
MKKLVLILVFPVFISCNKDDDNIKSESTDAVIFGEVYGMCGGDCRNLFLLNDEGLYKDADSDT